MIEFTGLIKKFSDGLNFIAKWISIIYIFLVTVLVLSGVFLRAMGQSLSWSEELARWLLVGIAFVSSSVALKQGSHVGITIIVKKLPFKIKKYVIQLANLMILVFLAYGFWLSFLAARFTSQQMGDVIGLSMIYVKMHIPISFLIMIIHVIYYIFAIIDNESPEDFLVSK